MLRRHSTRIGGLLLALVLAAANTAGALAQGEAVATDMPIIDENGVTRGTVTVREIADPFTDADPSWPPEDGMRYVGLIVAFTAADDQTLSANPGSIELHDTDGWLYRPTYVQRPADPIQPDLQGQDMAPGNRISGFVGYSIPEDAIVDEIVYTPGGYVSWTIADVRGGPGPAAGTDVPYTDMDGSQALIRIDVQDPFTAFDPAYPPDPGTRYVGLVAAYSDTGEMPFNADPSLLYLRTSDGNLYWPTRVPRPPDVTIPDLGQQDLAPGNLVSGFVGYEIPESSRILGVDLWPTGDRRFELADLAGASAGRAETAASSPSPEASAVPETTPGTGQ